MEIKTPRSPPDAPLPAPERVLPPPLPNPAPWGLQAGTQQSHPKKHLAFYSHRAAPFWVPKLPATQTGKWGVERGGGAVRWSADGVTRPDAGEQAQPSRPAQELPVLGPFRSAAFPAAAAGGRYGTAPAASRLRCKGPRQLRRLISWFTLYGRPRMGAGGYRSGFRPRPQTRPAATSGPKVAPQLATSGRKCSKGSVDRVTAVPSFWDPVPSLLPASVLSSSKSKPRLVPSS